MMAIDRMQIYRLQQRCTRAFCHYLVHSTNEALSEYDIRFTDCNKDALEPSVTSWCTLHTKLCSNTTSDNRGIKSCKSSSSLLYFELVCVHVYVLLINVKSKHEERLLFDRLSVRLLNIPKS